MTFASIEPRYLTKRKNVPNETQVKIYVSISIALIEVGYTSLENTKMLGTVFRVQRISDFRMHRTKNQF